MSEFTDYLLKGINKISPFKYSLDGLIGKEYMSNIDDFAEDLIYNKIIENKPLMISRFGSTELNCLVNYLGQKTRKGKYLDYLSGKSKYFRWEKHTLQNMVDLSGFFPFSFKYLEQFSEMILEDIGQIDILGSWLKGEEIFKKDLAAAKKVSLFSLEPYNHKNPWSMALEGKKVLVIHPFEESIKKQYANRHKIFKDGRVLPEFDLKTIKAVQSIVHNKTQFSTWFHALDHMKEKISSTEFDIAIIGCGAYGMPLAAYVKKLNKIAIHLGGATQVLFGIIGNRWLSNEYYPGFSENFINPFWTRPLESEIPINYRKVENGCYW